MLGILSDAHGNHAAFDRALALLAGEGATRFAFLGDALGYIPGTQVLTSIRSIAGMDILIRGNHEDLLLAPVGDRPSPPAYQHELIREQLTASDIDYLGAWPDHRYVDFPAGRALFVHGSPNDPTYGYLYPDTDLSPQETDADIVFAGHSHHPFIREHGGATFVNVGSCGLPRDDGRFGCVGLFDEVTGETRLIRFDITAETARTLEAAAPAHPSVLSTFARRRDTVIGDMHA